jgi:hypothetical protein
MSFHSDYLKDTGLLQAYQNFLKQLMNNLPKKESALEEASKFFSNYDKKYKPSTSVKPNLIVEDSPPVKKERKKIILETKSRVFPSAPVITPQVFERQERSRPLMGNYKTEPIRYVFNDIFDGKTIQLGTEDVNLNEKNQFPENDSQHPINLQRKNSDSNFSIKSSSSKRSKVSRKSVKSRKSEKSRKSQKSEESEKHEKSKSSDSDSGKSSSKS